MRTASRPVRAGVLVGFAFLSVSASVAVGADPTPGFVESPYDAGLFRRVDGARTDGRMDGRRDVPRELGGGLFTVAASQNVWTVPGLTLPGAAALSGTDLYVTNHLGTKLVTVVDVQTFGAESISGTIATPVDPVDIAVAAGELWVVGPASDALHHRPLTGGAWSSIPLPAAFPQWTYGDVLYLHPDGVRFFVVQHWENRIQVVDRTTGQVVQVITDLHHLPERLVFFAGGTRMAVLSVGLDAPDCGATGPHVAVYDVTAAAQRLFDVDVHGACPLGVAEDAGIVYAVRGGDVLGYDGVTALPVGSQVGLFSGAPAVVASGSLVLQLIGSLRLVAPDLSHSEKTVELLPGAPSWLPPLGEMVAAPDGRLFVCNRNDGTLTIVDLEAPVDAYGAGCPGAGDIVPTLGCTGAPVVGGAFSLDIQGGLGGAPAWLFLGAGPAETSMGAGCSLLVQPLLAPYGPFPLSGAGAGAGAVTLPVPVPVGTPLGTAAALQVFVVDAAGPLGFSNTNGLDLLVE